MIADGSHWWDADTMRFFRSRISFEVFQGIGGIFFVSSDAHAIDCHTDSCPIFRLIINEQTIESEELPSP